MEHKSVAFELKKEPDEDGVFEGYASVFGVVDQGMDVVERGAFTKSLGSGRNVKMLWQHDSAQPIGVFDVMQEDERGLFVRGRLLKGIRQSEEAMVLMRAGAIDSMSIGYRVSEAAEEGGGRIRKLMEVELFEISLVTFPMLEAAKITAMKSITTIREFEGALRDAGFSKTEAKAIAAEGFKGLSDHRDDVDDEPENDAENLALQSEFQKLMEAFNV
jgi:HK97 family phage prohead protease